MEQSQPQQNMGLFNYNVNLSPMVMDIRSETLEPISSSSKRFVFRLDAAGYLDQNSLLLFKLQNKDNNINLRVSPFAGGLAAISRATIQVGDYILNDTTDIGRISCLTSMGGQNEDTRNKYNGHFYQNQFHTNVLDHIDLDHAPHGGVGTIIYDGMKGGINYGDNNATRSSAPGGTCKVNSCVITNDKDGNYQFGIPLGVILPSLRGRQIPLFLFQDYRILITIEFDDVRNYVNDISNGGDTLTANVVAGGVNKGFACSTNAATYEDVKLQVDYIIYPSEIQDRARQATQQQGGLTLDFFDIIKVEKNIPATTANVETQKVEHRIGADNKEVHKIYMLKRLIRDNPPLEDRILRQMRCDGMNQESYNLNIDGVDYFQEDKDMPNSQYDETSNCLGTDLKVVRPMYYNDENTLYTRQAEIADGLSGKYKPLCVDLSNGVPTILGGGRQIGAYPLIMKYERRPCGEHLNQTANVVAADNDNNNAIALDLSGALEVDYFMLVSRTANIRSTPMGTSVVVSY